MASVFAVGVSVLDFFFHVEELPREGVKYRSLDAGITGGGMAASAAVAISRLGGEAHLAARLGDDTVSEMILAELAGFGVNVDHVHRAPGGRAAFSSVTVDRNGERQIISFRGSGMTEDTGWLDAAPRHDVVLADTSWLSLMEKALRLARRHDVPSVVDGERWADADVLKLATHLAFSRQGVIDLTGEKTALAGLKSMAGMFSNWICVTDGADGAYVAHRGRIEHIPAHDIDARNTLGAGDVWHGAFALMLAEGRTEFEAVRFANATATLRCSRTGGRESFPDRDEVNSFINAHG